VVSAPAAAAGLRLLTWCGTCLAALGGATGAVGRVAAAIWAVLCQLLITMPNAYPLHLTPKTYVAAAGFFTGPTLAQANGGRTVAAL